MTLEVRAQCDCKRIAAVSGVGLQEKTADLVAETLI